jgi:hypothetical protein
MKRTTPLPTTRTARSFRSRRLALVGAVVVLGLTACGDPNSVASPSSSSNAPALQVIEITGGASGGRSAAGGAGEVAAASADSKMMAAYIQFLYGGGDATLGDAATSWFFAPGAEPTQAQIDALANAFGLEPVAVAVPVDQGGGWRIGSENWEEPSITIGSDATLGWWYNPGVTDANQPMVDCMVPAVMPVEGDGSDASGSVTTEPAVTTIAPCPEPTPPANVPDEATARSNATAWLTSLGLDPASYELDVWADEWGANVTAYLTLDGMRTPMSFSIGYGAEGATTWASGFLATPQRGGDYPIVTPAAAVDRLNEQQQSWMTIARGEPALEMPAEGALDGVLGDETQPVVGDDAASAPVPMPTVSLDCTDPAVSCEAPMPVEIEPITVTLTAPTPTLEMQWADDGTIWLLPGYGFTGDDSGTYTVIAITDEYLVVNEPEMMPAVDPIPAPDAPAVEPPITTMPAVAPGEIEPGIDVSDERLQAVIGMTEADAATKLAELGLTLRVIEIDGVGQAATMDFRTDRVNVAVTDGVVSGVLSIG